MKISEPTRAKVLKYSQIIFCVLAWIFLLLSVTQITLMGRALFLDEEIRAMLTTFIPIIIFISVLMYLFGSAGWIPKQHKKGSLILVILSILQNYTVNGSIGVIYTAFFFATFLVSLYLAWGSYNFVFKSKKRTIFRT